MAARRASAAPTRFRDKARHSIYEAKTHFSRLVDAAERGREILITRNGRPVAKLVPLPAQSKPVFGDLKGKIRIRMDDVMGPVPEDLFNVFRD
jgi:prevent-host-death family protein